MTTESMAYSTLSPHRNPLTRLQYHTPMGAGEVRVPLPVFLRVDGVSFIGSDTALFHMITPLPHHALRFNLEGDTLTLVDATGAVFIARASVPVLMALAKAGFTPGDVPVYFAHGELLVEPNPRGLTQDDIARARL